MAAESTQMLPQPAASLYEESKYGTIRTSPSGSSARLFIWVGIPDVLEYDRDELPTHSAQERPEEGPGNIHSAARAAWELRGAIFTVDWEWCIGTPVGERRAAVPIVVRQAPRLLDIRRGKSASRAEACELQLRASGKPSSKHVTMTVFLSVLHRSNPSAVCTRKRALAAQAREEEGQDLHVSRRSEPYHHPGGRLGRARDCRHGTENAQFSRETREKFEGVRGIPPAI
ncbi:hypothetical protein HD554DRAFT_2041875 [Boletus coccyginus]|nr:hypothetical protein HD554DRAFT_2041875 [Boletus coccyginus]